jgi:CubicO group peptidase (beta-lactamase class C family)
MQDFSPHDGLYVTNDNSRFSAYTFAMSARDLARFAILYLRGGQWNGRHVIPQEWVKASTTPYSDTRSGGFGYLWWTTSSASGASRELVFPRGCFWTEGHKGQYAVVVPSLDLVVVNLLDERLARRTIRRQQISRLVQLVAAAAPRS